MIGQDYFLKNQNCPRGSRKKKPFFCGFFLLGLALVLLNSCLSSEDSDSSSNPSNATLAIETKLKALMASDSSQWPFTLEILDRYDSTKAHRTLNLFTQSSWPKVTNGFVVAKVIYTTTNFDDKPVKVSGLLALPNVPSIHGLVSWQHGTEIKRNEVPSQMDLVSMPIYCLFGGNPYLLVMPDYIGLGVSTEVPTYLHARSSAQAVIDLLKIAEMLAGDVYGQSNPFVFLGGHSQGAAVTTATQRKIETESLFNLKAVASISGPHNLHQIGAPYSVKTNSKFNIAYLMYSYSHIYSIPLDSLVQEKYVSVLNKYMNGNYSRTQIEAQLPKSLEEWIQPKILADIIAGTPNAFYRALQDNETYRYKALAPLRLYYGEADSTVSPEEAIQAKMTMDSLGGSVELISKGPINHSQSFFIGIPEVFKWWQGLIQSSGT